MRTLKVIVIDDEPGIRLGITRVLSRFVLEESEPVNFQVAAFETGEDGVTELKKERYDICLLDNKLPGIHGTEVLEHIGRHCEHKPLTIMITAFPSVETAAIAMSHGAFDFLGKPFKPDELKEIVKKAARKIISA